MLALLACVALAVALRAGALDRPLLGNFATKNCVYAMIARNWAEGRASLWYPTLDQLAGGQRSLHMLEWPVSAYLTGWLWRTLGGSLDAWGRATSVVWLAAAVAVLFLFVKRRHGQHAAVGAAVLLAVSPVSIVYGQSFMLEASLAFFTLGTFEALDRWLLGRNPAWLLVAAACFSLALLTKIYMVVLLAPLVCSAATFRRAPEWGNASLVLGLAAIAVAIAPAAAWYAHAFRTADPAGPVAAHVYYSVRTSADVHRPPHPLLRSPDFYRQALDDLAGVVLTPIGLALALAGFLDRAWRQHAVWLASVALLVALLPRKFHEMNYYWLAVLPPLCVLAGLGWKAACERMRPGMAAKLGLLAVALVFSLRYAARPAFVTPEEDRAVPAAAAAVQSLTGPDEPVVTMHGSGIDLLYYCDRPGWAVAPDTPELASLVADYLAQGARVAVVAGPEAAALPPALKGLPALDRGPGWVVLRLR